MQPAELHDRVRDGINTADVDALVALYEPEAVLMAEQGPPAIGSDAIRAAYESLAAYGGTITLDTRYAIERGELAMLSNQYTFSMPGYSTTWITSEVARRQTDGTWKYVLDNPYAVSVATS